MLQVLPNHISNLIAAGEVIQRPSNVVKELMENAVDAGATSVVVIINDSGRTLIQVIDNGCGMTPQEAAICFERHATSKIEKAEDLYAIGTYGFRGEALASVAACADVTLKTRKEGAECGTEIHIAESSIISQTETSCPVGCNFAIRNIFYNVPARRKFLKSDNVEYRQIVSEFTRVALTRKEVEFRLIHNSRDIFHATPASNIKQRITQLCGKDIAKDLITAQTDTNIVSVHGFIGRPEFAKKNQPNQYLFVNGRYFKSPLLHKAITKAYGNLIPDSTSPSYFLFLEIEPGSMDVNIHPSKTEIKFEDEGVIFEIVTACVKEAIGEGSFVPSIDFDTEGAPEIPVVKTGFGQGRALTPPKINYDPLFNPFDEEKRNGARWNSSAEWNNNRQDFNDTAAFEGNPLFDAISHTGSTESAHAALQAGISAPGAAEEETGKVSTCYGNTATEGYNGFFSEENACANPLLVLKGRYILTTVKSGLMLVDIARAKERIFYERYMQTIEACNQPIQEQLFPQTMDLDHNSYTILMENQEFIKTLGFDIRPFGENCVVVYGTPATFSDGNLAVAECVDAIIAGLQETGKDLGQEFKERIALDMVHRSGIARIQAMGNIQAQELIDSLFACREPNRTPQGHPVMAIITMEELARKL